MRSRLQSRVTSKSLLLTSSWRGPNSLKISSSKKWLMFLLSQQSHLLPLRQNTSTTNMWTLTVYTKEFVNLLRLSCLLSLLFAIKWRTHWTRMAISPQNSLNKARKTWTFSILAIVSNLYKRCHWISCAIRMIFSLTFYSVRKLAWSQSKLQWKSESWTILKTS